MNTLDSFLPWLLSASLRASVLALAVLGLQFAFSRWLPARWRHALWLPVVLVLLVPVLPASRFSVENGFLAKPVIVQAGAQSAVAQSAVVQEAFVETPPVADPVAWRPSRPQILFATWLLGACGMLIVGGVGYRRSLRRIRRAAVVTSAGIEESVALVAQQLGMKRLPRVMVSSAVDSPAVAGLLSPVLLLPASFPNGFSASEARMVLLHELTHLKRHDLPLNWLLCVLQALHWFNPLLWLAFARMRADRETACDAQVLGTDAEDRRADYGHALLKLQHTVSQPALGLAFVGIFARAGMRSRIRAIATHRRPHPVWGLATALMIAALTLVGATRAQEVKADQPKEAPALESTDQKTKAGGGAFVSFKDGTLTLKGRSGDVVWHDIPANTPVVLWSDAANAHHPFGTVEVLSKVERGTRVGVPAMEEGRLQKIYVGGKNGSVTGAFVSFKGDQMLLLGKDLTPNSFTKKYGNQLKFQKFAEDLPVFESIDGGDDVRAGTPSTALLKIKEGTLVTVHFGPGDGNFTRIEIGAKKGPRSDTAPKNTEAQPAADQNDKSGYGKFVSFKDGTLTLKGNYSGLVWNNIPETIEVVRWDNEANKYVPAGNADVLSKVEAGTWTIVGGNKALIRVGARKGSTTGTFVSYKDNRLLMLGKDLGPAYTKKYGNQLHMNKFADGVPVYESIDGGAFEYAGNPATVLPKVKEGVIITVHGAGDDNITRIDIGVSTKK